LNEEAVIARVEQNFSPTGVLDLLERHLVFVAAKIDDIVGTASFLEEPGWPAALRAKWLAVAL
jgi:hypothetical protein